MTRLTIFIVQVPGNGGNVDFTLSAATAGHARMTAVGRSLTPVKQVRCIPRMIADGTEWRVLTEDSALAPRVLAGKRGDLVAAGLVPALAWTAATFALQMALYASWFAWRGRDTATAPDELLWWLIVLIVASPLFDAVVFGILFLVEFPLLGTGETRIATLPVVVSCNTIVIAAGALALIGSGYHASLAITTVTSIIGSTIGAWQHDRQLKRQPS
jgi:hypothetical protein